MPENRSETFEQNMLRLEQIVRSLEDGSVPLEEAMKLFREGTELAEGCSRLLDKAEQEIAKLTVGTDGQITEVPYAHKDVE